VTNIKNSNKVSVVIPTYNRANHLELLLKSLNNQILDPEEVIIINDNSKDQTSEILDKWHQEKGDYHKLVYHSPINQGPGAARNIGIQMASGDLIAFTDDDCVLNKNWIKEIKNSRFWDNRKIAGIGGKVLPYNRNLLSEYYTFHRILEPPKHTQYLVTANACYRRELLMKINGFDEDHRYPGGEDNGLSFKLANLGYKFGFEKKMITFHNYRSTIPSFLKTFYRYGKGCAETTYKYLIYNHSNSNHTKKGKNKKEVCITK